MQVSYQHDANTNDRSASRLLLKHPRALVKAVYTISRQLSNRYYPTSRRMKSMEIPGIFSPYQSPSSVVVADKIIQKSSFSPIYIHNAAITKSYFISKPAQPKDHAKINILRIALSYMFQYWC